MYKKLVIVIFSINLFLFQPLFGQIDGNKDNVKYDSLQILYYKNGNIKEIMYLKNGLKEGTNTIFYTNGSVKSIQNYQNGKLNGWYYYFLYNNNLQYKCFYKDGLLNGKYMEFYANTGEVSQTGQLKNGLNVGYQRGYGEDGFLTTEKYFNKNGNLEKYSYYLYDGSYIKGSVKNGKKHGKEVRCDENGVITTIFYENGIPIK